MNERAGSPSVPRPASSSKARRRAPRKSINSASKSREVEAHITDPTAESQASSTPSPTSEPVEQEPDCGTSATESEDPPGTEDRETSVPDPETTPNAQEESPVAGPKLENFNKKGKSSHALKLEILRVLRRQNWEDKLEKQWSTPILLLLPRLLRKMLLEQLPKHPLSALDESEGFIYIFKSEIYPGYFKIGKTKQQPEKRISQWERRCKFTCIQISDPNDKIGITG
jgi:hypothetical protein